MCETIELTYSQLKERLKLLSIQYPNYKVCVNLLNGYAPTDTIGKARFNFGKTESNMLCYKEPFYCERYTTITVEKELQSLNKLKNESLYQKVIIVSHDNRTHYVCGVYVDTKLESLVLLNGYYNGKVIDWSNLKGDIY